MKDKDQENKAFCYKDIFDCSSCGLLILKNVSGLPVVDYNKRFEDMFYVNMGNRELKNFIDNSFSLFPLEKIIKYSQKAVRGEPAIFEQLIFKKNGKSMWVQVTIKFLISNGEHLFLVMIKDITRFKTLEKELVVKNKELEDFAFMVGHELKNYLLIVKSVVTFIQKEIRGGEERLEILIKNSEKIMDFVNRLLELSRSGKIIEQKVNFNPISYIKCVFDFLKPINFKAELVIDSKCDYIYGEVRGVEQIFYNLIQNSFQFFDSKKEKLIIKISLYNKEGFTYINYKDNGIGIGSDKIYNVFNVGYTTRKNEVAGFGLSIVKKNINAHNGFISVMSEGINYGTQFKIQLPLFDKAEGS